MSESETYDVVVVGASLAGCAAATLFGRAGARVALLERKPDRRAYKTVCTTFIQASATPTLARLGVIERIEAAGGQRNAPSIWSRYGGWIRPVLDDSYRHPRHGYNVRRQTLDPILRDLAATTPGVELHLGATAHELVHEDGRAAGVRVRRRDAGDLEVRARLVVGADGRGSRIAELSGLPLKTHPHGRLAYFAHYRDLALVSGGASQMWLLEPEAAYTFPMDDGVTIAAVMAPKERLPEFRADPEGTLVRAFAGLPDAPDFSRAERVSDVVGKVDMTNTSRPAAGPGVALVGDAAMASDPLWGVGCGFALQSAEWLVDATAEAVRTGRGVDRALARYRRRHRRALAGHHFMTNDFATGRPLNAIERTVFAAAARDDRVAMHFHAYGNRSIGPARFLAPPALARAAWVNARARRRAPAPSPLPA